MNDLSEIQRLLSQYASLDGAKAFFQHLGYPVIAPVPIELENLPSGVRQLVASVYQLAELKDGSPFRVYHVLLRPRASGARTFAAFWRLSIATPLRATTSSCSR